MWWMVVAQVGMSVLSSMSGGASQNREASLQRANQFEQARLGNEEVSRVNRVNLSNTMFNQGLIKMQDSLSRKQLMQNKLSLGLGEALDKGEVSLQSAQGGVVGATADALINDISKKYNDANVELSERRALEAFQTSSSIREAYTTYVQNMGKFDETGGQVTMGGGAGFSDHLFGSLLSVGGSLLDKNMSLGLGKKK